MSTTYQGWHGILKAVEGTESQDKPCWVMNEDVGRYKIIIGAWSGYASAWERVSREATYTGKVGWVNKARVQRRTTT